MKNKVEVHFLRRCIRQLFYIFNNRKLKSKMLMICIFGVIIPVIATNFLILGLVISSENKNTVKTLNNAKDAVIYELNSTIEETTLTAKAIYSKSNLNVFLDTQYASAQEYYNAYNVLDVRLLLVYGYRKKISDVRIYTDNETVIAGGSFYKINSALDSNWYKTYSQEIDTAMMLCMYYDESEMSLVRNLSKRRLSLIRNLDSNKTMRPSHNFVKIDIDYTNQLYQLINANYNADVYVVSDRKILFSNKSEKDLNTPFRSFDLQGVTKGKKYFEESFEKYGMDFKIVTVEKPHGLLYTMSSYILFIPIMLIINMVVPILVISAVNRSICGRILLLGKYFDKIKQEDFQKIPDEEGRDELAALIHNYNIMAEKMNMLIEVAYKSKIEKQNLELAKQQAELLALYSQINPHFLFNVLEGIRMRSILKSENETAEVINHLAMLMRNSISWKKDIVLIRDEVEFSKAYLELQKYRFGEKLSYTITVDEACNEVQIPKLTLSTFVENACVHGIECVTESGMVFVNIARQNDRVIIEIEDTGAGMELEKVEEIRMLLEDNNMDEMNKQILKNRSSIGIVNACVRLKIFFKNDIRFELDSEPGGGTLININLPYSI